MKARNAALLLLVCTLFFAYSITHWQGLNVLSSITFMRPKMRYVGVVWPANLF